MSIVSDSGESSSFEAAITALAASISGTSPTITATLSSGIVHAAPTATNPTRYHWWHVSKN